jgi:two-component system chemotaxis response regulator CheY
MLVKTTLSRISDLELLTADNGLQALELLARERVDLLVTDINMPEMDGIELVRAVRRVHDAKALPILIITAKGEEALRKEGLALGANACILKPLSGRELTELTQQLLGGSAVSA